MKKFNTTPARSRRWTGTLVALGIGVVAASSFAEGPAQAAEDQTSAIH